MIATNPQQIEPMEFETQGLYCTMLCMASISDIPLTITCISQTLTMRDDGKWTTTYLNVGRLSWHGNMTVAPSGTSPGYWPHSAYFHTIGSESSGLTSVKPTTNLLDACPVQDKRAHSKSRVNLCIIGRRIWCACITQSRIHTYTVSGKNRTNNILGITLTEFNKFSQFLAHFMLTCHLTKKIIKSTITTCTSTTLRNNDVSLTSSGECPCTSSSSYRRVPGKRNSTVHFATTVASTFARFKSGWLQRVEHPARAGVQDTHHWSRRLQTLHQNW